MNFTNLETILQQAVGTVTPAAQLVVRQHGDVAFDDAYGWLDPEGQRYPTRRDTLFDMASVTKLFAVTTFMTLVEEGAVALDQALETVLPAFNGVRPVRPYEDPFIPGGTVTVDDQATEADAGQVHEPLDRAHQVVGWNVIFQRKFIEKRALRLLPRSHHRHHPTGLAAELNQASKPRATRVFQQNWHQAVLRMAVHERRLIGASRRS